jgi:hypothetical protein
MGGGGGEEASPPDFSFNQVGWVATGEITGVAGGQPILRQDPAHAYVPNNIRRQPTYRIADLANPNLKPWVKERRIRSSGRRNVEDIDEGLETSLPNGTTFATRYYAPDRFVMTAGVGMPVDLALLTSAFESLPQLLSKSRAEAIEDRRFAEAVYRAAIQDGIMEGISYESPAGAGEAA